MSVTVTGLRQVSQAMARSIPEMNRAVGLALRAEGFAIIAKSVRQVPVDTGRLRQSAHVWPPENTHRGPVVVISYGTDYALVVHERMGAFHTVGKAKYLQDPVNDARRGYPARVGARAWRYFQEGR